MTRNDTRRADLLYPMSVDNALGDFVQKRRREILKKVLTNERSCSIIAKHLRETSGSESLESEEIGP